MISRVAGVAVGCIAVLTTSLAIPLAAQEHGQKTFASATAACQALVAAVQADNRQALLAILGPEAKGIISSGDPVEDRDNRLDFVQKYEQMHRLVTELDGETTLYIGAENWPTPIPLVEKNGAWYFDTAAGSQEVLYRRVGRNELTVIAVCRELVDAQKEYYGEQHPGESTHQYARKIFSDPSRQDGLYWKAGTGGTESPIGPFIAAASAEGYSHSPLGKQEPFHGYYFHVLTAQGPDAPGGAGSYIVDGKMTGGFAFVAFPAEYRSSGVMTFIVNQDGTVYEKDLGPRTTELAKSMTTYNPDKTWKPAE
jgi:hypothetical protein